MQAATAVAIWWITRSHRQQVTVSSIPPYMYSPLSAASLSSIVDIVVHDVRLLCIGNFYVSCWDGFPSMPSASYIGKQLKQWSVGTVAVGLLTKSCCFISIRNVDGVLGKWYHTGIINFPHPATSAAFNYGDFWVQDSRPIGHCEIKRRGDCGNNDMGEGETLCDTTKATTINITTILHPPIHPGWQQHHDCLATATQSQQQMRTTTWLLAPNFGYDLVKENKVTFNHNKVCWCKWSSWVPFKALHDAQKKCLGFGLFTQHAQDQKRRQLFEKLKLGIVSCIWHAMNTVVIQVAVSFCFQIALHCLVYLFHTIVGAVYAQCFSRQIADGNTMAMMISCCHITQHPKDNPLPVTKLLPAKL